MEQSGFFRPVAFVLNLDILGSFFSSYLVWFDLFPFISVLTIEAKRCGVTCVALMKFGRKWTVVENNNNQATSMNRKSCKLEKFLLFWLNSWILQTYNVMFTDNAPYRVFVAYHLSPANLLIRSILMLWSTFCYVLPVKSMSLALQALDLLGSCCLDVV